MKKIFAALIIFLFPLQSFAMTTPVMITGGGGNFPSTSATSYIAFMGAGTSGAGYGFNTFEPLSDTVISTAGTISNLHINFPTALTGVQTYAVTIVKNGVATSLTALATAGDGGIDSDLAHSVSVVAGDTLVISVTPSNTPAAQTAGPYISVQFDGTSSGTSFIQTGTNSESNSAVNYFPIGMYGTPGTTESSFQIAFPTAGTLSNLYVTSSAPGAGKTYAVTLRKAGANTALVATLSGAGSGSASDTTHTVSVAAGDLIDFSGTPTGTPTVGNIYASMTFTPTTPGESVAIGGTTNVFISNGAGSYINFNGGYGGATTESIVQNIAPVAFTLRSLYTTMSAAPGTSASRAFTARVNGSSQSLTATISNTNTMANDTTHSVSIAAGDLLDWLTTPTNSPAFSLVYTAAVMYIAPTVGLVSYWKLDDNSGTTAADSVGSNTGSFTSGSPAWLSPAKINSGLTFNGSGPYVSVPNDASLNTPAFSASFWMRYSGTPGSYSGLMQKNSTGATFPWEIFLQPSGKLAVYLANSGGSLISFDNTGTAMTAGTWYHVVTTYDSINGLVNYINGAVNQTQPANGTLRVDTTGVLSIGKDISGGGALYTGDLDEIGLWNRALTAGEVTQLYNSGTGLQYPFTGGGFLPALLSPSKFRIYGGKVVIKGGKVILH